MISRRHFLQAALSLSAFGIGGAIGFNKLCAQQKLTHESLTNFQSLGNVTLVHFSDLHAQLLPVYYREPSINVGVGIAQNIPPHITGDAFLNYFKIKPGSSSAYGLTSIDFSALAKSYGAMGGLDRISTIIKQIGAERGKHMLLLDGGDTWQGSYTALKTKAEDMIALTSRLGVDAMTGHWEFTYGQDRVKQLTDKLPFAFLASNIVDAEWEEAVFEPMKIFERGGVKIAVIGQAFPYTPIANPRYMMESWSFGIREAAMQKQVDEAKAKGAELIVLLSHNGFDVDRKMAAQVSGIDVILTAHTHDAMPEAIKVGKTLLIASGSSGKFVSRLDLDIKQGQIKEFAFKLIPVFSDVIKPDLEMTKAIKDIRAPFEEHLNKVIGHTDQLLYRRGNINGTWDDVICNSLLQEKDADIALSPGFRWGTSVLPGSQITNEDLYNVTAITYPNSYRNDLKGSQIKAILEDVADNLFHTDPYYQQGGDMVRTGGLDFKLDPNQKMGARISDLRLTKSGDPLEASKTYKVAGWASVNPDVTGPPIWDIVRTYLGRKNPDQGKAAAKVELVR